MNSSKIIYVEVELKLLSEIILRTEIELEWELLAQRKLKQKLKLKVFHQNGIWIKT